MLKVQGGGLLFETSGMLGILGFMLYHLSHLHAL